MILYLLLYLSSPYNIRILYTFTVSVTWFVHGMFLRREVTVREVEREITELSLFSVYVQNFSTSCSLSKMIRPVGV